MNNEEYIKSLEERISKLEEAIKNIRINEKEKIEFNNCNIQALGMGKCKTSLISDCKIEAVGIVGVKANIENSSIQKIEKINNKVSFKKCDVNNTDK